MTHTYDRRITNGILLYRAPRAIAPPVGSYAPPRFDLISWGKLTLLTRVLHVFFCVEPNPEITFTETCAYIPLPASLVAPPYDAVIKFLEDVPEFNLWLHDWSISAERMPDLSPPWALRRNLSPSCVGAMASRIAEWIAKSNTQEVQVTAMNGRSETLRIPSRASLVAPRSSKVCGMHQLRVKRKEDYMQAEAITGKRILVSCDAPGATSSAHGRLKIDLGRTRNTEVMVATDIDLHAKETQK